LPQSRTRTDINLGFFAAYVGTLAHVSALGFTAPVFVDDILDAEGFL
jgi:hypothetical protein